MPEDIFAGSYHRLALVGDLVEQTTFTKIHNVILPAKVNCRVLMIRAPRFSIETSVEGMAMWEVTHVRELGLRKGWRSPSLKIK